MNPVYDFTGQVALVTGASTGIGFAAAKMFAEAGAAVVMTARNKKTIEEAVAKLTSTGHKALGIACDVSDEAQVKALVERTVAEYGRLDMAYNNAGVLGPVGDATEETLEGFNEVTNINLRGIWACMKHELIQMKKQGSGAIVNCSSLGGLVGLANRTAYHGTKHGVIGLTKSAAVENAPRGIRINAICPGVIDTPMADGMSPEAIKEIMRDQVINRLGTAEEVAAAAVWLCSPASTFIIGVALPVDGGFVAH